MELSVLQLMILGVVSSGIVQLAKLLLAKFGYSTTRTVVTVIVIVVSVALGYVWLLPEVPPMTDPMEYAGALLTAALSVFAFATVIYNVLLVKVFAALDWTKARFFVRQVK